jgi:hypothetical protein
MQILRRYVMGYNPVRVQVLSDQRIHFGDRRMGGEGACHGAADADAAAVAAVAGWMLNLPARSASFPVGLNHISG